VTQAGFGFSQDWHAASENRAAQAYIPFLRKNVTIQNSLFVVKTSLGRRLRRFAFSRHEENAQAPKTNDEEHVNGKKEQRMLWRIHALGWI